MSGKSYSETTDRLDSLFENTASKNHNKNLTMAVESRDGTFKWKRGHEGGREDSRPFFIASIDKLMNAVFVMKLHESRVLHIDDKISRYLTPELTRKIHVMHGVDYSGEITIRHLLSHTSGIADWLKDRPDNGKSVFERLTTEGDWEFQMDDLFALVRDGLKPHFPPRDLSSARLKARYSDTNFMLLISIIENLEGRPLHKIYESHFSEIFRNTFFIGQRTGVGQTDMIRLTANGEPLDIPDFLRSDRAIYSTTSDLIAFMRNFINGELFANPETMELMTAKWARFGFPLDAAALRAPGWPIKYGLGIMHFQLPRIFTLGKKLPAVIGHTGSTGCWLFYCPELDVILCGNTSEVNDGALPYRIVPGVLQALI